MPSLLLGFITAFVLTLLSLPAIIRVTRARKLYAEPNGRSAHLEPTPILGGVGIFGATFCAIILWTPSDAFANLQYILAAFMIVFLVGVKDDLLPLSPTTKFMAQLLAATILVYMSDVRISSFYGILGIYTLPYLTSFILSVTAIVGIINAFNLIDGINGLAASIGLITALLLGAWFYQSGHPGLTVISFSLAGSLVAFLKFNLSPSEIFMGDTGSLFIGLVCAVLAINFLELHAAASGQVGVFALRSAPALAVSILILPIFDTLRVFSRRILQGRSPFSPDKTHIHHLLLDLGFSHNQSTLLLVLATLLFVGITLVFDRLGNLRLLLIQFGLALLGTALAVRLKKPNLV